MKLPLTDLPTLQPMPHPMFSCIRTLLTPLFTLGFGMLLMAAEDWPQFRGPGGQGHALAGRVPARWSEAENILWKVPIPGRGWSSPVIADGICWLTTAVGEEASADRKQEIRKTRLAANPLAQEMDIIESVSLRAVAVDLGSGKLLQNIELFRIDEPDPVHSLNSYASPSPLLNRGKLYCHFGNFGTACVETGTGSVVWKKRLPVEHSVGPGSSPELYDNRLIIPCDGTDAQSVIALDTESGAIAWKTNRPPLTGENGEMHKAFSTPLVIHDGERTQVVVPGAQWVVAYDPLTGKPLWQVRHGDGFSNSPRPIFSQGLVFICTGYMAHELVAIRVNGTGDVTNSHVVWRLNKQVPAMASPIIVGDAIYMVSDQGVVSSVDVKSGDVLFRERIAGNYSSSPLVADGKLFFNSRSGDVTVVEAGPAWKLLAKNHLDGQLMASPAVWRDSLIYRSDSHLYRIGDRAAALR